MLTRELKVFNKSLELGFKIYEVTKKLPREEIFGLTSQARRSAISISSNIAEGHGRMSRKSFIYFLNVSRGSLFELQTQIIYCKKLGYISENEFKEIKIELTEISKMISGLIKKLQSKTE